MADTTPQSGTTSLSDILSAIKNLVQGVNALTATYLNVEGQSIAAALVAATVVKPAPGRVARVSVIIAGSAEGGIYDGASLTAGTKPIYVIPMTVGVFDVMLPCDYGILVSPGTGQMVSVSWS
jgi:hypothetical protein